jgi:hypothetical protein
MEFQLGLIGWGMAGTGRPLDGLRQDGDTFDVDVEYRLTNAADTKALRQQILNILDAGATIVPLTWTQDTDLNGYYRLTKASTSSDVGLYLARRVIGRFTLERIQSFASPLIESVFSGARRSFVISEPGDVLPWLAMPSSWSGDSATLGSYLFLDLRLINPTMGIYLRPALSLYNTTIQARAKPANYYDGAVFLRTGPALAVETGRRIIMTPDQWSIDNGLVKITNSEDATSQFSMYTRRVGGDGWSPRVKRFIVVVFQGPGSLDDWGAGTFTITKPIDMTVLRNTPEEVVLSLFYDHTLYRAPQTGELGGMSLQLSLRRGARFANVSISSSAADKYGLRYTMGFTGTATQVAPDNGSTNYGIIEPSNDSEGQRSMMCAGSSGFTLANAFACIYSGSAVKLAEFGIGSQVDFNAAYETASSLVSQYLAAHSETTRIAGQ